LENIRWIEYKGNLIAINPDHDRDDRATSVCHPRNAIFTQFHERLSIVHATLEGTFARIVACDYNVVAALTRALSHHTRTQITENLIALARMSTFAFGTR